MTDLADRREELINQLAAVEIALARECQPVQDGFAEVYNVVEMNLEHTAEEIFEVVSDLLNQ